MALVLYKDNPQSAENWPTKRVKLDDMTPLGLKPTLSYSFACSFFQALFHIPIFRLAILAYRPTRNDWGEVEGYWNGSSQGLSDEGYSDNHWPSEFKSRTHTLKFMHELQKLFGFLSMSKRAYGDSKLLMEALNYEETRNSWSDWEASARDFVSKLLDLIVHSSSYRDLIVIDSRIPDSLSKYIMPFNKLLKSLGRSEVLRNYQSERKNEDVLCIPLEVAPGCNTVYAVLDKIVHKADQNVFFVDLAKILIFTIKHRDGYVDNSFSSENSAFHIDKELYMDRYMLNRVGDIEKRWRQLDSFKSEFEKVNQAIRKITDYQGRHSGLELLKGSIDYFRRKCDKARNTGLMDDSAQEACSFLEEVLEKVEQKLKVLIDKKEEIEAKMRDIFDTPDMKKVIYRLRAVLGSERQYGSHNCYAYIWVSRGNKAVTVSGNNENGNWWKFCDTTVGQVVEEQVLKDMSGNSCVYSLIYVNADADYNFSNINDVIPSSLKEYMKRDNNSLDEEPSNEIQSQDYQNYDFTKYNYKDNDYNDDNYNDYNNHYNGDNYNYTDNYDNEDVYMDNSGETETPRHGVRNSDSAVYDSSNQRIEYEINITLQQEKNMESLNPKINTRFEVFCIKLKQNDLFKSLMCDYYDGDGNDRDWSEPCPLDTKYQNEPPYKEYIKLFDKYKEITLYFTEGLERICGDEYRNALAYFKHAINLENEWIENLFVTDEEGKSVRLDGEKLQRSKEIDAYARACLKLEHECYLGKIRAKNKQHLTRGLKDGLQSLSYIVSYIGKSNCAGDVLFEQFRNEFVDLLKTFDKKEFTEDQRTLVRHLKEEYKQPERSSELKLIDEVTDDGNLYDRYEAALKKSSDALKVYEVPHC